MASFKFRLNGGAQPISVEDWQKSAIRKLPDLALSYFEGGADDLTTMRENMSAFRNWRLRQRVLTGVSDPDMTATIAKTPVSMPVALALECLHTYSLIHDDLPAMDDDDLRRGQPTVHVEFDEATAILAGDGLQALAFEIITEAEQHYSASICCRLVHDLAHSAGVSGMVGGQILDLAFEKSVPDLSDIERMQAMKTGSLFRYACTCGVTIGGGSAEDRGRLENFANAFGLAFQITDDLLDEEASKEEMGKRTGKDSARGKATFVAHLGIEGARGAAQSKVEDALAALQSYGGEADNLRHLCSYLLTRRV